MKRERCPRTGTYVEMPMSDELSGRELEVLMLYCQGYCIKQIAAALSKSTRTVEIQLRSCIDKSHTRTHAQLGVWAASKGLL